MARQLREAGHEVVALVRDPSRARRLVDLGVRLAANELGDARSLCVRPWCSTCVAARL